MKIKVWREVEAEVEIEVKQGTQHSDPALASGAEFVVLSVKLQGDINELVEKDIFADEDAREDYLERAKEAE